MRAILLIALYLLGLVLAFMFDRIFGTQEDRKQ
jgi:hypothetical protein